MKRPGLFDWDELKQWTKIDDGLPSLEEIAYMANHLQIKIPKKQFKEKNRAVLCELLLSKIRPMAKAYSEYDQSLFVPTEIEDMEALSFYCLYEPE